MKKNKSIKKIAMTSILLLSFLPIQVHAETTLHMELQKEIYADGGISRSYLVKETGNIEYELIDVPFDYQSIIQQSPNPLLTAKELLTKHDTEFGLSEKLAQLNNQKLPDFNAVLSVDPNYQTTFDQQSLMSQQYTEGKISLSIPKSSTKPLTSPEETVPSQKPTTVKQIGATKDENLDYSQINIKNQNEHIDQIKKEQQQYNQKFKSQTNAIQKTKKEQKNKTQGTFSDKPQNMTKIIAIIIFALLISVSIIALRKKVR